MAKTVVTIRGCSDNSEVSTKAEGDGKPTVKLGTRVLPARLHPGMGLQVTLKGDTVIIKTSQAFGQGDKQVSNDFIHGITQWLDGTKNKMHFQMVKLRQRGATYSVGWWGSIEFLTRGCF